jgi:hypothetical protein
MWAALSAARCRTNGRAFAPNILPTSRYSLGIARVPSAVVTATGRNAEIMTIVSRAAGW